MPTRYRINTTKDPRYMVLTPLNGVPSVTSGCSQSTIEMASNGQSIPVMVFDPDTTMYAMWTVVMPNDYNGGSITAQFYWTTSSSASGNVVWGIQCTAYSGGATIDVAWGTGQEVTSSNDTTSYRLLVSQETSSVTPGGTPQGGNMMIFRAYRNATHSNDTLDANAQLIGIKIKYMTQ